MSLRCPDADPQLFGDLAVGEPVGDEGYNLRLSRRQSARPLHALQDIGPVKSVARLAFGQAPATPAGPADRLDAPPILAPEDPMEPPKQINPTKLADYLEVLTRAVFESGMSWKIIEAKWPGFQQAFHAFDPATIASLTPDEIDALTSDTRIIRNRRKIDATIHNAAAMLDLEREHGTFKKYLESLDSFDAAVRDMRRRFKHVGDFGVFYFLYVVGEPVPDYHDFRAKLDGASSAAKK
jgi:hypothetical protein